MREGFTVIKELTIPSSFESMHEVESLIENVCAELNVVENYGNVLIAVTEAVNNAIIHGNAYDKDLHVLIKVGSESKEFCFSVTDAGNGFDFNHLPDPTAPENIERENGRGIFLMKNLSDDVVYSDYGRSVSVYFKI